MTPSLCIFNEYGLDEFKYTLGVFSKCKDCGILFNSYYHYGGFYCLKCSYKKGKKP